MARSLRDDPGRTGYWGLSVMSLVPQAKITIPQVPPEMVVRAGLRADLDTASRADVTLVCAPAGYGKTMLLADWAHTSTGSDSRSLGQPGPRRQRPATVVDLGSGRARRLPVGTTRQPPTRPLDMATQHPTGVPRRTHRHRGAATPPGPADPRRRPRTPRPRRPARPAHPAAQPPHRPPTRPVQPVRPAVVPPPATPHRPPLRTPRRPAALLPHRDRHPARTIRPEPHPHPSRHAAPTHRRLGRRAAPGRTRTHPDHQPRHVPRPVLRQRQLGRRLPDRRDPLRAARRHPRIPASDQHQQPRPRRGWPRS